MSEDLTKKLPRSDSEKITLILTTVQNLETRVDKLEVRFDGLEKKVDERLYDTRPIWQKVVDDIAQLQEGQTRLEGNIRDIKISVRDMTRSIGLLYETAIKIQAECRDLNHRVLDIELEQQKQRNSST